MSEQNFQQHQYWRNKESNFSVSSGEILPVKPQINQLLM